MKSANLPLLAARIAVVMISLALLWSHEGDAGPNLIQDQTPEVFTSAS